MKDWDNYEEAKVQNTKSQTEAALGAAFEILFGKKNPDVKYFIFFCKLTATLSTSCMLGLLQQQQKSRFKSGVSSKWEKALLQ
jgi:hypothetical protein